MTTAPRDLDEPRPKTAILEIAPYVAGASRANGVSSPIKLSSNENALGASHRALDAYAAASKLVHLYPDGSSDALRFEIAKVFNIDPMNIMCSSGSDEILGLLATAFLEPGDNAVQGEYAYMCYRIVTKAAQAEPRFAPEPNYRIDIGALLDRVDRRTKIVFVANPGNPTGSWLSGAEIRTLHRELPGHVILVLDGAYAEYVDDPSYEDGLALARETNNVVVTRTFSKVHGLAGLRVGWSFLPPPVMQALSRIRPPFNVNVAAQAAAVASLGDTEFVNRSVELARHGRLWLRSELARLGLSSVPTQANFLLVNFSRTSPCSAEAAYQWLASRGILVRDLAPYGITDSLRITVGSDQANRAVINHLSAFLSP